MQLLCDTGGLLLVGLTWLLFIFAHQTTKVYVFDVWFLSGTRSLITDIPYTLPGTLAFVTFRSFVALAIVCHVRAALCNPGSLELAPAAPPLSVTSPKVCKLCSGKWKPPRAHHCRKCGKCIFRMDHHCPWINNCVGLFNQKFFILFLLYTVASCGLNLVMLLIGAMYWLLSSNASPFAWRPTLALTADIVVSAFFLFMAFDFLSEQYEAVLSNSTLVESYQSTHGIQLSLWDHIKAVFGRNFMFYCLPIKPDIITDFEEPVLLDDAIVQQIMRKRKEDKSKRLRRTASNVV
eukprot:Lankesteria_metandrocarpae@DN9486_c0_g1_i1.p1